VFLPLGDYPNPKRVQWVTRLLLAGNIAVHLLVAMPLSNEALTVEDYRDSARVREAVDQIYANTGTNKPMPMWFREARLTQYSVFTYHWGFKPGDPSLATLLACMFLHGNLLHLFGNMLFLWIYGDNVEERLGLVRYLLAYLGTGAAATAGFGLAHPDSMTPLVGASGAISGVLGMYLVWFPRNLIRVLVLLIWMPYFFLIRAYWVIGMYFVFDNLIPLMADQTGQVAVEAHIAGFGSGALLAVAANLFFGWRPAPAPVVQPGEQPRHWHARGGGGRRHAPGADYPGAPHPGYSDPGQDFRRAIREHRMEDAAHAFAQLLRTGGLAPEPIDVYRLGRWLADSGYHADARAVLGYYLKHYPYGAEREAAEHTLATLE